MNEDLLKEIKSLLPWAIAAVLVVGGYYAVKNHIAAKRAAASEALVSAYTAEELEEGVAKYGSSDVGGVMRLRLAKKYFDLEKYDQALKIYDEVAAKAPDGFADVPPVGRAQCLEALKKYTEAQSAFAAFAEQNPDSPLALTAKLGAARTQAFAGDEKGALAALEELKKAVADDELAKARVDVTEDCIRRRAK